MTVKREVRKMTNPKNSSALTPIGGAALPTVPDELLEVTAADGPLGVSQDPIDQLLFYILLFQTNSPQVDKFSPNYVAGAGPGAIWFRGDVIEVRDGVVGFEAIVCHYLRVWNIWGPVRGSGLQGKLLAPPPAAEVEMRQLPDSTRPQLVFRDSGNVLQECRELYVLVNGRPYVMPFHGSGHRTVKQLQMTLSQYLHPKTQRALPAYAHKFLVQTTPMSNGKGRWFGFKFTRRGFTTVAEYEAGRELYRAIARGAYRVEQSDAAQAA
jgi:hypothetical protein